MEWQRRFQAPLTIGEHGMAEAAPGTANNGGAHGMAEAAPGTADDGGAHGMAEAVPGTAGGGEWMEWQRRLQVLLTVGNDME